MATDMATLQKEVGEKIRDRRLELGMTQAQLAKKLKTSQSVVSDIEVGRYSPTLDTIERCAKVLGVPLRDLLP